VCGGTGWEVVWVGELPGLDQRDRDRFDLPAGVRLDVPLWDLGEEIALNAEGQKEDEYEGSQRGAGDPWPVILPECQARSSSRP
jgi:hypothetical protein